MEANQTPVNWVRDIGYAVQWPVIVLAAFWLGRYVTRLEQRVLKAEKSMTDLITRHMPHLHTALNRIEAALQTIQALVQR